MKIYDIKTSSIFKVEDLYLLEKEIFNESSYSLEILKEIINSKEYAVLIAIKEQQIISYLIIHDSFDIFEIMKIGVKEEFRNQKIAENLMQEFLKKAEKDIHLEVRETNTVAQNFYKKNRFKEIGKRKNYYSNGETAILMKLEINK